MAVTTKKILVLVSGRPKNLRGFNWDGLRDELDQLLQPNVDIKICALSDLVYTADSKPQIYHAKDGYDIADFDLVLFRTVGKMLEYGIAAAHYLHSKHVRFTDTYLLTQGKGKLACSFARVAQGLPVARTIYAPGSVLQSNANLLQFPLILKADIAKKGRDNYLVSSKQQLKLVLKDCAERNVAMIAQEYIRSKGDYRILVLNYKPRLALFRISDNQSHLTNTSQGGNAELIELSTINKKILADAVAAARLEKLEIAGVDIIVDDRTGKHYILEVNRAPQLPTGAFAPKKMRAYANAIQELLIFTPPNDVVSKKDIIGRVELADLPDLGHLQVPAKIDTGADRSSIWCSEIKEIDGELHCVFFDTDSPWYSGEVVVFTSGNYTLTRISNSFGDKELRYKVQLRIKLASRTIKATFTLANRSQKLYPILIGRATLRNKFLVDVSKGSPLIQEEKSRANRLKKELNSLDKGQ